MANDRFLDYYLESDYFLLAFIELLDYFVEIEFDEREKKVCTRLSNLLMEKSGYYTILKSYRVDTYFNKDYSDLQLSAIIWGLLLGMDKTVMSLIANKHYNKQCIAILRMCLSGSTICEIKKEVLKHKNK